MNIGSALGNEGRARWLLKLFGGFELSTLPAGEKVTGLGKRERVLLAYLALNPKGREQRRKLTTLLWGDAADETTLDNLRNCLYGLRKALGDGEHRIIASDGEEIVLDAAAFDVDALAFRRLTAQSGRAELEAAAKLYSGSLLDGLDIESEEFESWRRTEAQRCRDQAVGALHRLMTQLAESGETDRAIETGQRILALDPLHESSVRLLMRLYAGSGRRSAAIQLYRTLSDALKAELDAQPEAETRAVFEESARGGEEQPRTPAAAAATSLPSTGMPHPSAAPSGPLPLPAQRAPPAIAVLRQATSSGHNWLITGSIAAAIALFLLYEFVPSNGPPVQQPTGVESAKAGSLSPTTAVSIAVLPFANLSGDPSQEFFSDGMTEEITAALAKIPDLRVVARGSAFQFKDEKRDTRAVGRALGATHLIEGSVRKEGDRVRITAQLVEANQGVNVWTESYDRQLASVFATQEDIATAIAGALRMPLGLRPGERLVSNRNIDPDSYQQYLRARALFQGRLGGGLKALNDAIALLEQVVARNPDYAPAWALLANVHDTVPNYSPEFSANRTTATVEQMRLLVQSSLSKAEPAARKAIQLDPNLAEGYRILAAIQGRARRNLLQEEELRSKTLSLDPNDPGDLGAYSNFLAVVGRVKEAVTVAQQVREVEPFLPIINRNIAVVLWLNGRDQAAIEILRRISGSDGLIAMIQAGAGHYDEAADTLLSMAPSFPSEALQEAVRLLRMAPAKVISPNSVKPLGSLDFVYLYVGAPEQVLEYYEVNVDAGWTNANHRFLSHPSYGPARRTERYKAYARKAGLVDYWRAKGWPEFCRPIGADDFVCE